MLSAHGLHRTMTLGRKTTDILRGCDLELEGGGLTAIVGHSGSGKSSLLMCLSGLDQPTSGTVMLNGRDIYHQSEKQRAKMLRSEVGFVFQQYNLVPFLSVEENISLSFRLDHSLPPGDLILVTERILRLDSYLGVNSSGQHSAGHLPGSREFFLRTSQQGLWIRKIHSSFLKLFGVWLIMVK